MLRFASALAGRRGGGDGMTCVLTPAGDSASRPVWPVSAVEAPPLPNGVWLMRGSGGRAPVGRIGGEDSRWHGFRSYGLQNPCHLRPSPGWGRHTCHPVPYHRAARRKRTAKPEHSAGVVYMSSRPLPPRRPAEADGEAG